MWVTVAILKALLFSLLIDEDLANMETNFHQRGQENFEGNNEAGKCETTVCYEETVREIYLGNKEMWALKSLVCFRLYIS